MKKQNEPEGTVPQIPMSPNDLQAIEDMMTAYSVYLQHNGLSTSQTRERIQLVEEIRGRLLKLHAGEGTTTMISASDVFVIRDAMITFVAITRRTVPQSSARDETLQRVTHLRRHLEKSLFPYRREKGT